MGRVIVITGPTASGKSALALELASKRGLEIISADSRQIYTGIPIVSALPSPEELASVKHHLIDMLPLDAYYSASMFEEDALRIARHQLSERGEVIVCGGSMMYIDAFCYGIDALPTIPDEIRHATYQEAEEKGPEWALSTLKMMDPAYYDTVDRSNMKRVIHAIEIMRAGGKSMTDLLTGEKKKREFEIDFRYIDMPRDILFKRINERVDRMVEAGLEEEARRVYPLRGLNSLNTVGLKEMFAYFDGQMDRTTAIERIKKNTRVYAKKQETWHSRRLRNMGKK